MPRVKVKKDWQVSIPKALAEKLKIKQGDFLSASEATEGILLKVKHKEEKIMADEFREYWRKRVQEEGEVVLDEDTWKTVEAAIQASERGEVIGPFDNIEDALKVLFSGCIANKDIIIGRGRLPSGACFKFPPK